MIPVPMIKEVLAYSNGIDIILRYGLFHSAMAQKVDSELFAPLRQLLYCYYRDEDALTPSLKNQLDDLVDAEELSIDEDYHGFYGQEFFPEEEINALYAICEENMDFKNKIYEWYKIYLFYKLANLVLNGESIASTISVANKYCEYKGAPYARIGLRFLIDIANKCRSEKDRARIAMLLSICSIVGKKKFAATTKKQIVYRMFGAKNDVELEKNLNNKSLKGCYVKYTTRKVFEKLRDELLMRNMLKCYHGHAGRVYVSNQFKFADLVDEIADFIKKCTHSYQSWQENENELMKRLTNVNKGTS